MWNVGQFTVNLFMGTICPQLGYMTCIVRFQPCVKQNRPFLFLSSHPPPKHTYTQGSKDLAATTNAHPRRKHCISNYSQNWFLGSLLQLWRHLDKSKSWTPQKFRSIAELAAKIKIRQEEGYFIILWGQPGMCYHRDKFVKHSHQEINFKKFDWQLFLTTNLRNPWQHSYGA